MFVEVAVDDVLVVEIDEGKPRAMVERVGTKSADESGSHIRNSGLIPAVVRHSSWQIRVHSVLHT